MKGIDGENRPFAIFTTVYVNSLCPFASILETTFSSALISSKIINADNDACSTFSPLSLVDPTVDCLAILRVPINPYPFLPLLCQIADGPRALVDYFCVAGLDSVHGLEPELFSEDSGLDLPPIRRPYRAFINDRFPDERDWNKPFDAAGILMLCFPQGLLLRLDSESR